MMSTLHMRSQQSMKAQARVEKLLHFIALVVLDT